MRPLPVSPTNEVRIGSRLRAARKAHGYTLDQLATASGLTKGFLSRVERDETSLSVASLITLCEVMSMDVGSLFTAPEVALVRRDGAPAINLGGTGVNEQLMTPRGQSSSSSSTPRSSRAARRQGPLHDQLRGRGRLRPQGLGRPDLLRPPPEARHRRRPDLLRGRAPHLGQRQRTRAAEVVWVLSPRRGAAAREQISRVTPCYLLYPGGCSTPGTASNPALHGTRRAKGPRRRPPAARSRRSRASGGRRGSRPGPPRPARAGCARCCGARRAPRRP